MILLRIIRQPKPVLPGAKIGKPEDWVSFSPECIVVDSLEADTEDKILGIFIYQC